MDTFKVAGLAFAVMASAAANAGQLTLLNGDKVSGELQKITADSIVWKSDLLGEVSVAKSQVVNFTTDTELKVNGFKEPCKIDQVISSDVTYTCGGTQRTTPLLTLKETLPYAQAKTVSHSYSGKLDVTGSSSSGNKEEVYWDISTGIVMRQDDIRQTVDLDYEAKSQNDDPVDEFYEAAYQVDWFFLPEWFWYGDLKATKDEDSNIAERYQLGTGLGYQFWETEQTALSAETGITQVKENFEEVSPGEEKGREYTSWRSGINYRYALPFGADFYHKSELLASLEESEDWEIDTETGLGLPLFKGISTQLKLEYDYDNQPADEQDEEDTRLTIGLGYKW